MSTEGIANFIVSTDYEQIDPDVVKAAKNAILDYLACTLAGSAEAPSKLIAQYAREIGGKREAGVIGQGFKSPAPIAALANGTTAHSMDYDDASVSWVGHPTAAILPAVIALGEKRKSSGKEILQAYILGFEVGGKIGLAIGRHLRAAGWHTTGILGNIASAVGAAKLLRLDAMQTRMALGIAASATSGIMQNIGTMTKPLHAGYAARNGAVAALLAQKGFTANENIFDGEKSYSGIFGGEEWRRVAGIDRSLGNPWDMTSSGLGFKPYPSCRGTHAAIDAALALMDKYRFGADDIAEVECHISSTQSQSLLYTRPQTGLQGKFCVEYCVTLAFIEGKVSPQYFSLEKISEPKIQKLLSKTKRVVPVDAKTSKVERSEIVKVKLNNGKEYSKEIMQDATRGSPKNPLTFKELSSKYEQCAATVLKPKEVEQVLDLVSRFESIDDISELMDIVTGSKKKLK